MDLFYKNRNATKSSPLKKGGRAILIVLLLVIIVIPLVFLGILLKAVQEDDEYDVSRDTTIHTTRLSRLPEEKIYLLNKIDNISQTINYAWYQQILVYAKEDGIYEAGSNRKLLNAAISFITFSDHGHAIYVSRGEKYYYHYGSTNPTIISSPGEFPRINPSGDMYLAIVSSNEIVATDINNPDYKTISFDTDITYLGWINSDHVLASTDLGKKVTILDRSLKVVSKIETSQESNILGISPNLDVYAYSIEGSVILRNIETNTRSEIKFGENSILTGNWVGNNELIIIETFHDSVGRIRNNFWKMDKSGSRIFLSDSNPILRKIDTNYLIKSDGNNSVITLVENSGNLWLISLIPDTQAYLTPSGLVFVEMPTFQDPHHHDE